ncbi:MAG: four-helix bundle copper-binding protein, partial [Candidatus Omnitrophica bacterium]|nr:four-helix bundle copper-binding protein [Candidatus Omnitrophota bacterium]
MTHEKYQKYINICEECAVICEHCAMECLGEKDVKSLTRCIELDRTCTDICRSAAAIMARGSEFSNKVCGLCAQICQACADECAKHQHMEHCQDCAEICY